MVYLIFVLVVPVVPRPGAHIGQRLAFGNEALELLLVHPAVAVGVEHVHHLPRYLRLPLGRDVLVRLVSQAVGPLYLLGLPVAVGVVIVQREEGGGVEVADVVLLWGAMLVPPFPQAMGKGKKQETRTCHVLRHPTGILLHHWLLAMVAVVAVAEHRPAGKAEDDKAEWSHRAGLAEKW